MLPNQIILLGGGASIRYLGAIDKGLFKFLQDKFTIGINYSHKWCPSTCSIGVDEMMYNDPKDHGEIAKLPLWIGKETNALAKRESNSIFFKPSNDYDRELKTGIYRSTLSGIFALSLAIKLLDLGQENPELYLLGYDYGPVISPLGEILIGKNNLPITHRYQEDFQHRGTGKINWYTQTSIDYKLTRLRKPYAELEFRPFASEKKVKIFNVGGTSKIPTFPKMEYDAFFSLKLTEVHNQDTLRNELREVLLWIKQENQI